MEAYTTNQPIGSTVSNEPIFGTTSVLCNGTCKDYHSISTCPLHTYFATGGKLLPSQSKHLINILKGKNFSMNNTGKRKKSDFYETPYSLTRLLLEKEKLVGEILEPAVGNGAIGKVLNENQYSYMGYDIENDFLKQTQKYDTIITNPPYSLSQKFILKAKENARKKIIFLLPLSYLHGKKRHDEIWTDKDFPLARVYIFTRYPLLGEELRQDGKHNTGMMVYAWFIWEKNYKGEPIIKWLDNNEYILTSKDNLLT